MQWIKLIKFILTKIKNIILQFDEKYVTQYNPKLGNLPKFYTQNQKSNYYNNILLFIVIVYLF